jgi:hypothetical protein
MRESRVVTGTVYGVVSKISVPGTQLLLQSRESKSNRLILSEFPLRQQTS